LYEHQKKVLEAVMGSFDRSLGAASQGALLFNRRIIDITARNVTGGLEHAMKVARAKNLAEAMELHGAYWHKQFDELTCQIEEIRAVLIKVAADMAKITTNK
jgi:hypothetical protein